MASHPSSLMLTFAHLSKRGDGTYMNGWYIDMYYLYMGCIMVGILVPVGWLFATACMRRGSAAPRCTRHLTRQPAALSIQYISHILVELWICPSTL
eukprot:6190231-Pleurochrysis_carterae.AAC.2